MGCRAPEQVRSENPGVAGPPGLLWPPSVGAAVNTPPWETHQEDRTNRLTSAREEATVTIRAPCAAPTDVPGTPISALGVAAACGTRWLEGWWPCTAML